MFNVLSRVCGLAALCLVVCTGLAAAQSAWVQIEARPTQERAVERANAYANALPDVQAYRLSSGWFAIALGPYEEAVAEATLLNLRLNRAIPSDSFISDGRNFREQVFGSDFESAEPAPQIILQPAEETVEDARASERGLNRDERELLQVALRYEGFYNAAIDGSFGAGTRRAMAAWQQANGFEPTGILSSAQRRDLVAGYRAVIDALGIARVQDQTAGIEIAMPTGLVEFTRYDAPFAIYGGDDAPRVLLISQIGDDATLKALYDILQTLEIMPLDGPRELRRSDFTLTGENARIVSHIYARQTGDAVKGFALIWPAGDEKRRRLVLDEMVATFAPVPGQVLPDAVSTEQDIDLMAGLKIRRPDRVRSGFFVSDAGDIVTTADAVEGCARVTLGDGIESEVVARDSDLGVALLSPKEAVVPLSVARLPASEPRLKSEIAVSGYSFGGLLGAPSLTYGTFDDNRGLDGDRRLARLTLAAEETDAGGPVLDASGAVAGILLSQETGQRQLPQNVVFAASAGALSAFLAQNGVNPRTGGNGASLDPLALRDNAADMTVLIGCWN